MGKVLRVDLTAKNLKEEYYKLRGWVNGIPTPEKLKELEIEL